MSDKLPSERSRNVTSLPTFPELSVVSVGKPALSGGRKSQQTTTPRPKPGRAILRRSLRTTATAAAGAAAILILRQCDKVSNRYCGPTYPIASLHVPLGPCASFVVCAS